RLEIEVHCGKGTYIRALARDLGERLGCGGLIDALRRTQVGPFRTEDALPLGAEAATARSRLLPLAAAVSELPRLVVSDDEIERLRQGQAIPQGGRTFDGGEAGAFDAAGNLVAVVVRANSMLRPDKVFT